MLPYIATFGMSYLFVYVAESKFKSKKNSVIAFFLLALTCFLLSMLAALRDEYIGTDVLTYVNRYFYAATQKISFYDYTALFLIDSVEPLYFLLNYIVATFTDNVRVMYFVIELWDVVFVLAYLWENRKKASVLMGFFVFTMMMYNISFNAVRQTMALCVCLYSFNSARDRQLKKFIVLMLIAILIHRSSVLMIITYPLMRIFESKSFQKKNLAILLYSVLAAGCLLFVNTIVGLLINIGLFPIKFSHYIGSGYGFSRLSVFVFVIPVLLMWFIFKNKMYRLDDNNAVMFLYIILWALFAQLDSVSDQFGRLAYGFMLANIPIYSQLPYIKLINKNVITKNNTRFMIVFSLIFWMMYWYFNFAVSGTGATIPYKLGI